MNKKFEESKTWEEYAASLPRNAPDTDRLMAAIYYRFEEENSETTEIKAVTSNYFRRARWSRPINLSATANYCAGKGWLSEVGRSNSQKLWKITKSGYQAIKAKLQV